MRFLGGSSSRDLVPDAGARLVFFGDGSLGNTAGWALAAALLPLGTAGARASGGAFTGAGTGLPVCTGRAPGIV